MSAGAASRSSRWRIGHVLTFIALLLQAIAVTRPPAIAPISEIAGIPVALCGSAHGHGHADGTDDGTRDDGGCANCPYCAVGWAACPPVGSPVAWLPAWLPEVRHPDAPAVPRVALGPRYALASPRAPPRDGGHPARRFV